MKGAQPRRTSLFLQRVKVDGQGAVLESGVHEQGHALFQDGQRQGSTMENIPILMPPREFGRCSPSNSVSRFRLQDLIVRWAALFPGQL
jgi:hypothetical protein